MFPSFPTTQTACCVNQFAFFPPGSYTAHTKATAPPSPVRCSYCSRATSPLGLLAVRLDATAVDGPPPRHAGNVRSAGSSSRSPAGARVCVRAHIHTHTHSTPCEGGWTQVRLSAGSPVRPPWPARPRARFARLLLLRLPNLLLQRQQGASSVRASARFSAIRVAF